MPAARFRRLQDCDLAGRRVLVRVDLNVPLKDGPGGRTVADDYRLQAIVPTLDFLQQQGAKTILLSHLGRPETADPAFSLAPVAAALSATLGRPVAFVPATTGPAVAAAVAALQPGDVVLLENLRFDAREEANDAGFAAELAGLGDLYVNDAFAVSHRAHASVAAITAHLPSAAGLLLEHELAMLARVLGAKGDNSSQPLLAIVGGAKVSTKLRLLDHISESADMLFIGGAMANTFLAAQGIDIGTSLAEPDMIPTANQILLKAQTTYRCEVMLPLDAIVAGAPAAAATQTVPVLSVPPGTAMYDAGPATLLRLQAAIDAARTIVWNGPLGLFEQPAFAGGTQALARMLAAATAAGKTVVAGGGDTVAALAQAGLTDKLTFVSTAGGAFLEWLEGRVLPGVAALEAAK